MSKTRIAVISLVAALAFVAAGLVATFVWLLYTPSGLHWLTARAQAYAGEGLALEGVSGTLAGGAAFGFIRYAGEDIEVRAADAQIALSPLSLLKLEPTISFLNASEVAVTTRPGEPRDRPPDTLALPANFEIAEAFIGRLVVDMGQGPIDIADLRLAYEGGRERHSLRRLSLTASGYAIVLKGTIDASPPFALTAEATAESQRSAHASATATLGGNLSAIDVAAQARAQGGVANVQATLTPYEALPVSRTNLTARNIDLHAFLDSLPRTEIEGDVALALQRDGLAGDVHIRNGIAGPYDKALLPVASINAKLTTDLEVGGFTGLQIDLGKAGSITGSGTVMKDRAKLALSTRRIDLAALYTEMRHTQLSGAASIDVTAARQTVHASLTERDISLRFSAERTSDVVKVERFAAVARGGSVSGSGTLALTGRRMFTLAARFARFDPASWGEFPAGSINGALNATGSVADKAAEVSLSVDNSRWLGAGLSANAQASVTAKRVSSLALDASLGGNRMHASGSLGAPGDVLRASVDAPRLDLVDRSLRGIVHGKARLSGALNALDVRFDVTASAVGHTDYGRISSLEANGNLSLAPAGAMQLQATLKGLAASQISLASASVHLDGTRASHTLSVSALGERIDLRVRAAGGLQPTGAWRGTIQEFSNDGELALRLVSPVSILASAAETRVEPFTVAAIGGRLAVSRLVYRQGQLTTSGNLANLPVDPLLALAGRPAGARGTLRLSGAWDLRNTPQWSGSVSLRRDSGDLELVQDRITPLRLTAMAADAKLGSGAIDFRANVASALAQVNASGRLLSIAAGSAVRYGMDSPLEFTVAADVERLAPLAAFVETPMLVAGEAHARLRGRGTVRDPQVSGPLTVRHLALALPVEGISLTDGTLDASLESSNIRVDRFSIRGGEGVFQATGTLARGGFDQASLDWRAERFTALSRPDRRLVVSGSGNAALRSGKVSLTGKLSADEGEFEIGASELPTLDEDIVVAGRERKPASAQSAEAPKQLGAISLDLAVALGERVHVSGQGLSVWLAGNVHVYTGKSGDILAKGTVIARNGTFAAYGQRLEIDRGFIYFNGPIAHPSLDIVAMRKRQAVEAGVAVTGTLDKPLLRIVSNPQVPEGEALSWLVLGRAPGDATAGELSALPLAANAAFGKATAGVKRSLRLDELSLGGAEGGQFVTLGKRIGKRLYVGFEQSLGAMESVLRLEYTLTRRLVVRAQTGETSLLGLFYRYRWD